METEPIAVAPAGSSHLLREFNKCGSGSLWGIQLSKKGFDLLLEFSNIMACVDPSLQFRNQSVCKVGRDVGCR